MNKIIKNKYCNSYARIFINQVFFNNEYQDQYTSIIRFYDPSYSESASIFTYKTDIIRLNMEDSFNDAIDHLKMDGDSWDIESL